MHRPSLRRDLSDSEEMRRVCGRCDDSGRTRLRSQPRSTRQKWRCAPSSGSRLECPAVPFGDLCALATWSFYITIRFAEFTLRVLIALVIRVRSHANAEE